MEGGYVRATEGPVILEFRVFQEPVFLTVIIVYQLHPYLTAYTYRKGKYS